MNVDEIPPAGRERDVLIAQKIFGHEVRLADDFGAWLIYDEGCSHDEPFIVDPDNNCFTVGCVPDYSTDIVDSTKIVEWVKRQPFSVKHQFMEDLDLQSYLAEEGFGVERMWWFMLMADWPDVISRAVLRVTIDGKD